MYERATEDKRTKEGDDENEKKPSIKKYSDLQRLKLEKLMKNYDKAIVIPERPKEKNMSHVPEFIRNVMGSSAGAGSGEFHVYRHLRRKEYARQKFIQQKSEKEILDEAYKRKLEENARLAEERTAKKRAKRLKKKEKQKARGKKLNIKNEPTNESEQSECEDDQDEEKLQGSNDSHGVNQEC
ncbi:hypothetical protein RUM44_008847 [Polyplax serrata]|uniref:PRKR-interacting protein 1 n=1 Tax=Polyplax serrata TaxID=468196 RepID=A0ABR1B9G1_POLSC